MLVRLDEKHSIKLLIRHNPDINVKAKGIYSLNRNSCFCPWCMYGESIFRYRRKRFNKLVSELRKSGDIE